MITAAEARARILAALTPLPAETVALTEAMGRVLAEPVVARVTQPWAAVSAMDGYAVRAADLATVPTTLRQVGIVPAGQAHPGTVGPGECVRIFTGAPLPQGADTILIQEDAEAQETDSETTVTVRDAPPHGRYVRPAGLDFEVGSIGLGPGRVMTARDVGLAAAMDVPWVRVHRRPRVALLMTGDEIALPGDPRHPNQIVSSNGFTLAGMVRAAGGDPIQVGIAPDQADALRALATAASGADLLVTSGGASVGEHDLVRRVLGGNGADLDFWKIAMRPGKPLMFGRVGPTPLLGLPGNPVSTAVCGLLFLVPAIRALQGGDPSDLPVRRRAILGRDLPENDRREDYLRSRLVVRDGTLIATPFPRQDSAMMSVLARADALVVRAPHAPATPAGETVDVVLFHGDRGPF